jgi:hypothetical protein
LRPPARILYDQSDPEDQQEFNQNIKWNLLRGDVRKKQVGKNEKNNQKRKINSAF